MTEDKGASPSCEGCVLHVANVPEDATHSELVKIFRKLHSTEVFLCDHVHPVRHTRFAFVTFATRDAAAFALADCARRARFLHGRVLAVSVSRASPQRCPACGEVVHRADVLWHTALLHSPTAAHDAAYVAALPLTATAATPPDPSVCTPAPCAAFARAAVPADWTTADAAAMVRAKEAAVGALQAVVRGFWDTAELACFGSLATGVSTAYADDVDVALLVDLADRATGAPWAERGTLCALRRHLRASGHFPPAAGSLALTLDARVPILSYYPAQPLTRAIVADALADSDTEGVLAEGAPLRLLAHTRFDLCVNRTAGVLNSALLRDYARAGADPAATHTFLVAVRRWGRAHRVVRPRDGLLNAYCLQLMAVAFLQRCAWVPCLQRPTGADTDSSGERHGGLMRECGTEHWWHVPVAASEAAPEAASEASKVQRGWCAHSLFAHFLHYYAVEFDWDAQAVDVAAPDASGASVRPAGMAAATGAALCVLDPLEHGFNVARHLSPLHRTEIVAQMTADLARLHRVATSPACDGDGDGTGAYDYAFLFEPV